MASSTATIRIPRARRKPSDRFGVSILILWLLIGAAMGSSFVNAAPAGAATSEQVTILNSVNGGQLTSSPQENPPHHTFAGNWAADVALAGAQPVYARFSNPTGNLALSISGTGSACASGNNGGLAVRIQASVDGVVVGNVWYLHLSSLTKTSGAINNGDQIGVQATGLPYNVNCWTAPHSHIEPYNSSGGYSCFVNRGLNTAVATNAPLGVLGGNFASGPNQTCPAGAENPSTAIVDGSFVSTPDGSVYRIAGGAPLYVSSWANIGGPQTVVNVPSLAQFRSTPVEGTFLRGLPSGSIYRVAGGAPIYVSSWSNIGGPQAFMDVDAAAIDNAGAGGVYNHLNAKPAAGTFLRGLPSGSIYRVAGGAPIYVSSWANIGGQQAFLDVDAAAIDNAGAGGVYNHLNAKPTDGTFIRGLPSGMVYRVAGGGPIYVSSWTPFGGVKPYLDVDAAAIDNAGAGGAYNHLTRYPRDGTVLTGLPSGVAYTVTGGVAVPLQTHPAGVGVDAVAIANAGGTGQWSHLLKAGSGYAAVTPSRILDSRGSNGGWNAKLTAGSPRSLQATGLGGGSNVPSTATAVVLNVTATAGSASSFVTVYPAGTATPNASNLNFGAGQTIANLVTVKLGSGGQVAFANAVGSVDVIADVVGYYDDGTTPGDTYSGITPTRLLDSRSSTGGWSAALAAGAPKDLIVRQPGNAAGVPSAATAVIANVTVTGGSAASFLSVWPSGVAQPNVSNLNFAPGQTIPNLAIIKIGTNGSIRFANAVGDVHVIVDVVGYFDPTTGSRFHAITPTRVLDDRVGKGLSGSWGPAQTRALSVAGAAATNVSAGATGLVTNVTATGGTAGSFITVFPDGVVVPNSSNVNFGPGETVPNLVTVKIAANGKIDFYNKLGNVDIIADAVGYYAAT